MITVERDNGALVVKGLAADVAIFGFEAGLDRLVINGLAGDDVIDGGAGDDVLIGGAGNDVLQNGEIAINDFMSGTLAATDHPTWQEHANLLAKHSESFML